MHTRLISKNTHFRSHPHIILHLHIHTQPNPTQPNPKKRHTKSRTKPPPSRTHTTDTRQRIRAIVITPTGRSPTMALPPTMSRRSMILRRTHATGRRARRRYSRIQCRRRTPITFTVTIPTRATTARKTGLSTTILGIRITDSGTGH